MGDYEFEDQLIICWLDISMVLTNRIMKVVHVVAGEHSEVTVDPGNSPSDSSLIVTLSLSRFSNFLAVIDLFNLGFLK
jgi:hypothetical protein